MRSEILIAVAATCAHLAQANPVREPAAGDTALHSWYDRATAASTAGGDGFHSWYAKATAQAEPDADGDQHSWYRRAAPTATAAAEQKH
ncbi:hypothetical protein V2A60_001847 [Cordyceps javanica]